MKVIIKHSQDSIDPIGAYTNDEFPNILSSLEREYSSAISLKYPEAEIDFIHGDYCGKSIVVSTGLDDPSDIEDDIQVLCEDVYSVGNWIWVGIPLTYH